MGFKRNENRGKKLGSRSGGWNPSHKLVSREERANLRQDLETRAGSTLTKLQVILAGVVAFAIQNLRYYPRCRVFN